MEKPDFTNRHFLEALYSGVAEANGNTELSQCLLARTKLRIANMSDDRLRACAAVVTPPGHCVETAYAAFRSARMENKATVDWLKNLTGNYEFLRRKAMMYKVLVIESEPALRNLFISSFTGFGFLTIGASDYLEALQQIENFNPDMVIMDSVLPNDDGFEVCSELHSRFKMPVILMGPDRGDGIWDRVMKAGADHYEVKPVRYFVLAARARAILRRYYSPAAARN